MEETTTVHKVREYWQAHPLLSFELEEVGSPRFFEDLDKAKREDADRFSMAYWEFNRFKGKKVLDVGCGPGWLTVNYTLYGADVTAVDLTSKAVDLTREHLRHKVGRARVLEADAESLPFKEGAFDLVVASGVLHHTPNTYKAMEECARVLKPGGIGKITLYHKGILQKDLLFSLLRPLMKLVKIRHPGADLTNAKNVDDLIRQYDGSLNPIGIGKTKREWLSLLQNSGFIHDKHELHYFPQRFLPFKIPSVMHYLLDRWFGTMIYFQLKKPL